MGALGGLAQSVVDFLIEDCCVLCQGLAAAGVGVPRDPRLAALVRPVRVRYLGGLELVNHPVCQGCLDRFEPATAPGRLCRITGPGSVETAAGDRFEADGNPGGVGGGAVRVYSPFMTNDAVLKLVHRFKFSGYRELAGILGGAMAASLGVHGVAEPRLPVVMPMTRNDRRRRGFNAVGLLAGVVVGKPVVPGALEKVRRTGRQSLTPHEQRGTNVRGAFRARPATVAGRRVLLFDDLVTSGATAASATAELLAAGARSVEVLCFARAL